MDKLSKHQLRKVLLEQFKPVKRTCSQCAYCKWNGDLTYTCKYINKKITGIYGYTNCGEGATKFRSIPILLMLELWGWINLYKRGD